MKEESNNNNNESNTTGNYPNIGQQISVSISIHLYFPPFFIRLHSLHTRDRADEIPPFNLLDPDSFLFYPFPVFLLALSTQTSLRRRRARQAHFCAIVMKTFIGSSDY